MTTDGRMARLRRSNSVCLTPFRFFTRKAKVQQQQPIGAVVPPTTHLRLDGTTKQRFGLDSDSDLDDDPERWVRPTHTPYAASTQPLRALTPHERSSSGWFVISRAEQHDVSDNQLTSQTNQVETEDEDDDDDDDDDDAIDSDDNNQEMAESEPLIGALRLRRGRFSSRDSLEYHRERRHDSTVSEQEPQAEISTAQKRSCFQYIKRRHSIAMAFASTGDDDLHAGRARFNDHTNNSMLSNNDNGSHWEFAKVKNGVEMFKSRRSRCEIRGVTKVNASVKNVMSLLAAGETTEGFTHAQTVLLGRDQVLESRVLASCVPSAASRYFHCGLKYMAMKNPFGMNPLDLVFLDYTDVVKTPDDKLVGFRIIESIRVPEYRSRSMFTRASIRCEVYIVRETNVPGVVEVTFASHLDPKSKYSASKRNTWFDQTVTRLCNLRSYAEKASFSHYLLLEKAKLVQRETRHQCFVCQSAFSFLRKRHNCRLCGEVSCGRCCRKLPILIGVETTRVRVCVSCMLHSRRQPDELGRTDIEHTQRNSIGNKTWIAYDEHGDDDHCSTVDDDE